MSHDHNRRSWPLPFADEPRLELKADASSVILVPVEPGQPPRIDAFGRGAQRLDLRVDRITDTVRVQVEPFRQFTWWGGGDFRLVVRVPHTIRARVETTAGSIDAESLDGCQLDLRANAGRINLDRVRGRLRLSADAGSITGRGLAGSLEADTQAGSIRLELVGLDPGEHRVHASMGSIRLELARGLAVRVESRTSMGSSRINYPAYPQAPALLRLDTDLGSIRVSEAHATAVQAWSAPAPDASPRSEPPPQPQPAAQPSAGSDIDVDVDVDVDVDPWRTGPRPSPAPAPPSAPAPAPARAGDAEPELERILQLVEAGKLSARDAEDLLQAIGRA